MPATTREENDMAREHTLKPDTRDRAEIAERYTWDLSHIYPDWDAWVQDLERMQQLMDSYQELRGTLAEGPKKILEASLMSDELGQLA
jgi:oligoendopeptidase F